ncbi:hypothetical protein [Thiomicrorhabdus sp.]|uniref:hypothetical protein n=1 Tax=Thiomicrorhabdus sp. TaxID=2039724 RepID=UPI002AA6589A|nr:hypothetical protein [Thiomicrorhabdus sp.]
MVESVLNLLDLGLSPMLGRQVAYTGGQVNDYGFLRPLKSFEVIFFGLTLLVVAVIYFVSGLHKFGLNLKQSPDFVAEIIN